MRLGAFHADLVFSRETFMLVLWEYSMFLGAWKGRRLASHYYIDTRSGNTHDPPLSHSKDFLRFILRKFGFDEYFHVMVAFGV
jgi:hypothetical protein